MSWKAGLAREQKIWRRAVEEVDLLERRPKGRRKQKISKPVIETKPRRESTGDKWWGDGLCGLVVGHA